MERYLKICSKCGELSINTKEEDTNCEFCNNKMIQTNYTADEAVTIELAGQMEEVDNKLRQRYTINSPEYDQNTYYAREDKDIKKKARVEAQHQENLRYLDSLEQSSSQPHCPTCNSTSIKQISGAERTFSVLSLGLFSKKINKSFKCKNCGYTW